MIAAPHIRRHPHPRPIHSPRLWGGNGRTPISGPEGNEDRDRIRQKRLRILVVDDEDGFRAALCAVLRKRFHAEVTEAEGPRVALDRVETHLHVHLVLLDLMMPGMDGVEVCERMRALGLTAPVVLMSAHDSDANRARAQALGVRMLGKPLDPGALQQVLLECGGEVP